ncbi:ABC transporter permease [Sphaerisporangium sp. NPDC051011]|uniref:ABC transporter permease n=1 Tax=Sphaerisporangium sp. NPDC051011 TaxID=3155792 RepID=UPI0033FFE242
MSTLRAALRISRRNAWRSKRRTGLILAMIALPVIVATCVATGMSVATAHTDSRVTYPLGQADAVVWGDHSWTQVTQDAAGNGIGFEPGGREKPFTTAEITQMFGPGSRAIPMSQGTLRFLTPQGYVSGWMRQVDLRDPLSQGTFRLLEGRLPAAPGEVVAAPKMLDWGATTGMTLFDTQRRVPLRIVGVVLFSQVGTWPDLAAFPGSLPTGTSGSIDPRESAGWLVDAPNPVSWADVRRLNAHGLVVVSRAVLDGGLPPDPNTFEIRSGESSLAAVPWIGMMLLEVVLLAGSAFAVGRRRRAREFALVAAQGGSPGQLRMIALADGLLFGAGASVIGTALGIGAAALTMPRFEMLNGVMAGPFEVPWGAVAVIVVLGITAGLLAALAPAARVSRTDAAAVLAGRRAPGRDRAGRPVLGLVLILAGITATVVSTRHGIAWIVASALLTQLGLVAVVPRLITLTGRLAGFLPLPLRFAARDAARNRGRTAPAVAAVMTAVVALTALGVAWKSGMAQGPTFGPEYPQGPAGAFSIQSDDLSPELWDRVRAVVRKELPASVPVIEGQALAGKSGVPLGVDMPTPGLNQDRPFDWVNSSAGGLLIGDENLLRYVLGREDRQAVTALHDGKAVVLNPAAVRDRKIEIDVSREDGSSNSDDPKLSLPAIGVRATGQGWARAVVAPEAVRKRRYTTATVLLLVNPADFRVSSATAQRIAKQVGAITLQAAVRLEVPDAPDDTLLLILLGGAAAVLVLGMTFVATMLAAVEARPDLETMSAVGAAPRLKRAVVAGQALVIALLGSATGVLAGLAPGIAVRWPLAHRHSDWQLLGPDGILIARPDNVTPVIAIPWTLIGLTVIGLPLMAALGGALLTRSRLPTPRRRAM